MAIYASNTFEAAVASGTAISTANSGGAAGRAFDQFTVTEVYDSTVAAHGTLSAKFTQSASTSAQARWVDASNTASTCYSRFYLYITAAPTQNTRVMHFANVAGTQGLAVRLKTNLTIDLLDSPATIMATSTTTVPLNTWVRIEAKVVPSATVGSGEAKIYTTADSTTPAETITSGATFNTLTSYGMWRWGPTSGTAQTFTCWFDDVAVSFDAYPGPSVDARSGTGTVTATTSATGTGSKSTAGTGTATLATGTTDGGTKAGTGTGTMTATAGTSSTGTKRATGASTLGATATLGGSGVHAGAGSGGTAATATAASTGTKTATGTGSAGAATTLQGTGAHAGAGTGTLAAATSLTGAGGKALMGSGALTAATGMTPAGGKTAVGSGALTAAHGLASAGTAARSGAGVLTATVLLTSTGAVEGMDLSRLSGTARVRIYTGKAAVRSPGGTARVRRIDGDAEV